MLESTWESISQPIQRNWIYQKGILYLLSCNLSRALLLVSTRTMRYGIPEGPAPGPQKGREPLTGHQISPCLSNLSPPTGTQLQEEEREVSRRSGRCSSPPRRDGQVHRVFLPRDRLKAFENTDLSISFFLSSNRVNRFGEPCSPLPNPTNRSLSSLRVISVRIIVGWMGL